MLGTINPTASNASSQGDSAEQNVTSHDTKVNTDNLSPEAARRFERFAGLVDRFEKAAFSGAISPPSSSGFQSGR